MTSFMLLGDPKQHHFTQYMINFAHVRTIEHRLNTVTIHYAAPATPPFYIEFDKEADAKVMFARLVQRFDSTNQKQQQTAPAAASASSSA